MISKLKNLCDVTFIKFVMVGVVNTLFGTAIMFLFYNVFHLSYWISSASNYVFGSVLSYFLNKYFTFKNHDKSPKVVFKFILNISVCYLVAYGVAKPLVQVLLSDFAVNIQDNCSMLTGMVFFVFLNYFGQRFFAFKSK